MPLLESWHRYGVRRLLAHGPSRCPARCAKVGGDFVGQHFFQTQAEQVRSIAAIGPRRDVSARSRRATRAAVARRAAIGEAGTDAADVGIDVANAVTFVGPCPCAG